MKIINIDDVPERALTGRYMKTLISAQAGAEEVSMCLIRMPADEEEAQPAHSHPTQEEILFVLNGTGTVNIAGEEARIRTGDAVFVPKGAFHVLTNTGGDELRVLCCFAPPAAPEDYVYA